MIHKQPLHPDTYIGSALVIFIIGLLAFLAPYLDALLPQKQLACTQEAKVCPDGSTVVRTGSSCTFMPCPNDNLPDRPGIKEEPFIVPVSPPAVPSTKTPPTKKEVMCTQDAKMCSDGSFVGRVAPSCDYAPCPDDLELDVDR
jgi:hypothetical protein